MNTSSDSLTAIGIRAGAAAGEPVVGSRSADDVDVRFRTMADCAPVLLWMTGTDGLCDFFNAGWLRFTGRTLHEEMGNGWAEGVHPEDFQDCMNTFMTCFVRREAFAMEYRLRRHDGEYRWILDQGAPHYDEAGCFTGFIGSCVDITVQRQANETLAQVNAGLARQVKERTALARAREELLREVHHRVKNDLQLVASLLRMQGSQISDARAERALTLCEERIHAIARVHEHMYQSEDISRLAFSSHLRELADIVIGATPPQVRVVVGTLDEVVLRTDRAIRCSMIVHELLANAVQHAFPDSRAGTIRLSCHATERNAVIVCVEDDGIGLAPLPDSRETLGWVLVRALARQIHAELRISVNAGTRVEIVLSGDPASRS